MNVISKSRLGVGDDSRMVYMESDHDSRASNERLNNQEVQISTKGFIFDQTIIDEPEAALIPPATPVDIESGAVAIKSPEPKSSAFRTQTGKFSSERMMRSTGHMNPRFTYNGLSNIEEGRWNVRRDSDFSADVPNLEHRINESIRHSSKASDNLDLASQFQKKTSKDKPLRTFK